MQLNKLLLIFLSLFYFSCSDNGNPIEQNELNLDVNFGNIVNGSTMTSFFTIHSPKTSSIIIKNIFINNDIDSCFVLSNYFDPFLIQNGSNINIPINFIPSISGVHFGEVIVETDRDPIIVSLIGESVEPALLFLNEYSINFDEKLIENIYEEQLILYNIGQNNLEILNFEISNPNFYLSEYLFPLIIEGLDSLSILIYYSPTDVGVHSAELMISTQFIEQPTTVLLSGTGKNAIQFQTEILPIFQNNCVGCHGGLSGVTLTNEEEVLNSIGEQYAMNAIIPGDSDNSPLINKISTYLPQYGSRMPLDNPSYFEIYPEKIQLIKDWIDQLETP